MSDTTVTFDVHDPRGIHAGTYVVIGDPVMVVPGPPRIAKKSLLKRLLSLRPWVMVSYEPTTVPSEHCIVSNKKIFCHPVVAEKIIAAARQEKP
jgi:hypothetical protein